MPAIQIHITFCASAWCPVCPDIFFDNVLFSIFYIYSTKINLDLYFRLASFIFSLVSMTKANVFAHYVHDGKFCLFLFDLWLLCYLFLLCPFPFNVLKQICTFYDFCTGAALNSCLNHVYIHFTICLLLQTWYSSSMMMWILVSNTTFVHFVVNVLTFSAH